MPALRTGKELRGFLGRIIYIGYFIAKLTTTCEPLFKLLRKNEPMVWNNDCQIAFKRSNIHAEVPPVDLQNIMVETYDKPFIAIALKPNLWKPMVP